MRFCMFAFVHVVRDKMIDKGQLISIFNELNEKKKSKRKKTGRLWAIYSHTHKIFSLQFRIHFDAANIIYWWMCFFLRCHCRMHGILPFATCCYCDWFEQLRVRALKNTQIFSCIDRIESNGTLSFVRMINMFYLFLLWINNLALIGYWFRCDLICCERMPRQSQVFSSQRFFISSIHHICYCYCCWLFLLLLLVYLFVCFCFSDTVSPALYAVKAFRLRSN